MKIIFAGTPVFARTILQALLAAEFEVAAVLTRPDQKQGRGLRLQASPVKELAQHYQIPVLQPATLKEPQLAALLGQFGAEVLVVAAYGLIIPPSLLNLPPLGCINVHASLLPRWRGAAPIARAIIAGDKKTGISMMQMDRGLDTGAVLAQAEVCIAPTDNTLDLTLKLQEAGASLAVKTLKHLSKLQPKAQADALATFAPKITKAEARLNWQEDAAVLERKIRAFTPVPGAKTVLAGRELKIWRAGLPAIPCITKSVSLPGTVVGLSRQGLEVTAGRGSIILSEIQKAGGKRMPAAAYAAGHPGIIGTVFS